MVSWLLIGGVHGKKDGFLCCLQVHSLVRVCFQQRADKHILSDLSLHSSSETLHFHARPLVGSVFSFLNRFQHWSFPEIYHLHLKTLPCKRLKLRRIDIWQSPCFYCRNPPQDITDAFISISNQCSSSPGIYLSKVITMREMVPEILSAAVYEVD